MGVPYRKNKHCHYCNTLTKTHDTIQNYVLPFADKESTKTPHLK